MININNLKKSSGTLIINGKDIEDIRKVKRNTYLGQGIYQALSMYLPEGMIPTRLMMANIAIAFFILSSQPILRKIS